MKMNGQMPHDTTPQRREVFLSRAASRKELAQMMHEFVLPLLDQHEHNLLFLKKRNEELDARVKDLEGMLKSETVLSGRA